MDHVRICKESKKKTQCNGTTQINLTIQPTCSQTDHYQICISHCILNLLGIVFETSCICTSCFHDQCVAKGFQTSRHCAGIDRVNFWSIVALLLVRVVGKWSNNLKSICSPNKVEQ